MRCDSTPHADTSRVCKHGANVKNRVFREVLKILASNDCAIKLLLRSLCTHATAAAMSHQPVESEELAGRARAFAGNGRNRKNNADIPGRETSTAQGRPSHLIGWVFTGSAWPAPSPP